jgi:hypothetical protein
MSLPLGKIHQIHSHSPQEEIWNYYINRFTNKQYVKSFLCQNKRVKSSVATTITNNAKQALDFYYAYENISMLSKPILLFYSFEKLARMMTLFSTKVQNVGYHGLTYRKGAIVVMQEGLFCQFHDCYSSDASIYEKGFSFKLNDLLKPPIRENELSGWILRDDKELLLVKVKELTSTDVIIHELDREFMFIFALSYLSRYKVNEWGHFINGINTDLIIRIRRYMQSIELFFPTLILSFIYGLKFLVESFSPMPITRLDDKGTETGADSFNYL